MKAIEVHEQVRLGPVRCLHLTLAGMYYRLTRSTITVAIFSLAVAFLTYVYVNGVVEQERGMAAAAELKQTRALGEWMTRLSVPDADGVIIGHLLENNTDRLSEYRRWGGISRDEFERIRQAGVRFGALLSYFDHMRGTARAILLGDLSAFHLPGVLRDDQRLAAFLSRVKELSLGMPLGSADTLRLFIRDEHPLLTDFVARAQKGQSNAIDMVRRELGSMTILTAIATGGASMLDLLSRAGYIMDSAMLNRISGQTSLSSGERSLNRLLGVAEARAAVARRLNVGQDKVDLARVTRWVTTLDRAEELHALLTVHGGGAQVLSAGEILKVSRHLVRSAKLQRVATDRPVSGGRGFSAMPEATRWLIVVSFMVCAFGICNTMFMSVTERFTEIATMKCLGAMDGFIMQLFVFESIIMGMVGSAIGIALGMVLVLARGVSVYGGMLFESFPVKVMVWAMGTSCVSGVLLAVVAAVGPAWMAARLAPMEAMRVE